MSATLFSSSGGLIYHWRAHRNTKHWQGFRDWVAAQFESIPTAQRICIFGASAGYTLPWNWIERFKTVAVVEPDPLARRWLRQRTHRPLEFLDSWESLISKPTPRLCEELRQWQPDFLLFANLLGQIAFSATQFESTFKSFHWASYHDLISCMTPLRPGEFQLQLEELTPEALVQALRSENAAYERIHEVIDHRTLPLHEQNRPFRCAWWPLTRTRYHLIGFREHRPNISN